MPWIRVGQIATMQDPKQDSKQDPKFAVPHEIEEILDRLPPQVTLNVPDHILSLWFPPGPADGGMDGPALERAQNYARTCGCKFGYHRSIREGVFYKLTPSGD